MEAALEAGGSSGGVLGSGQGWRTRVRDLVEKVASGERVLQAATEELVAHSNTAAWQEASLSALG